jgi:methionyl-tRNA formyltransferase
LLLKTVDAIASGEYPRIPQSDLDDGRPLKSAPRIFRDTCRLVPAMTTAEAFNRVRGLSPYPAAFLEWNEPDGTLQSMKVFRAVMSTSNPTHSPGTLESDGKTLRVYFRDGWLEPTEVQPAGKARMGVRDFLNGRKSPVTGSIR